jgi:hypothetical protein
LSKKVLAFENEIGLIPKVKMIEEGHRLTSDQESGISFETAKKIVNQILKKAHEIDT